MSIRNPDLLIPLLDELIAKIDSWKKRANASSEDALQIQRQADALITQSIEEIGRFIEICQQDEELVNRATSDVGKMSKSIDKVFDNSVALAYQANSVYGNCQGTLIHWQSELDSAQAWLAVATEKLKKAVISLQEANKLLISAQTRVSVAQSALNNCKSVVKTDKEGRRIPNDCSAQEAELQSAKSYVHDAEIQKRKAEAEVREAEMEVSQANARITQCSTALSYASQAVSVAQTATLYGKNCQVLAERAKEIVKAAGSTLKLAKASLGLQLETLESAAGRNEEAISNHSQANTQLLHAENLAESALGTASKAESEIDFRNDFLREFASIPNLKNLPR